MLYDNAQLARVYLHACQVKGNEFYKRITIEILDYVVREMTDPNGGFYLLQDADSEGHERKFFVWTLEKICSMLGASASGLLIIFKYDSVPLLQYVLNIELLQITAFQIQGMRWIFQEQRISQHSRPHT